MSEPIDHHYVPVFYLERWAGPDGKVLRFSRPYGEVVVSKRVSPSGTAFETHLYSMNGPKGPPLPDMEKGFMSRLDSEAADVLHFIESNGSQSDLTTLQKEAWARFVWAQTIRTPSEIAQLKSAVKESWAAGSLDLYSAYSEQRTADDPETYDEYLRSLDPYHEDRLALEIAQQSMDHSGIIEIITKLHWRFLSFHESDISFLTSDRPVWMTATLTEPTAGLLMPIGPFHLFAATRDLQTMRDITSRKPAEYAKCLNRITVEHAVKFVFGGDKRVGKFVQRHFAKKRHSTPMERLAAARNYHIVASESPAQFLSNDADEPGKA